MGNLTLVLTSEGAEEGATMNYAKALAMCGATLIASVGLGTVAAPVHARPLGKVTVIAPPRDVYTRTVSYADLNLASLSGEKMLGTFSSGMAQRLSLARAFLTRPSILLLDEPTRSLDPVSARDLRHFLREDICLRQGCTVVLATHSADEAAFLGSRIVVLTRRPGRVALDLPVELPRTGVDPDELRRSPEHAAIRTEVGRAVKAAAA